METIINNALDLLVGTVPFVQMVLMILGGLCALGAAYVKVTPRTDDDTWWKKNVEDKMIISMAVNVLRRFSPVVKK